MDSSISAKKRWLFQYPLVDQRERSRRTVLFCLLWFSFFWCHAGDLVLVLDLGYDTMGRLASVTHPHLGNGKIQAYTFNDQVGHDTVSYDGSAIASFTEYTQGGAAKKVNLSQYGGHSFGYLEGTFDELNRMKSLKVDISGPRYQESSINYNSWVYVSSFDREADGLDNEFTYSYGNMGELIETAIDSVDVDYVYDDFGNLIDHNGLNGVCCHSRNYEGSICLIQSKEKISGVELQQMMIDFCKGRIHVDTYSLSESEEPYLGLSRKWRILKGDFLGRPFQMRTTELGRKDGMDYGLMIVSFKRLDLLEKAIEKSHLPCE